VNNPEVFARAINGKIAMKERGSTVQNLATEASGGLSMSPKARDFHILGFGIGLGVMM